MAEQLAELSYEGEFDQSAPNQTVHGQGAVFRNHDGAWEKSLDPGSDRATEPRPLAAQRRDMLSERALTPVA